MKKQTSIFVIDDERIVCESCDRILSKAGYKVDTSVSANNGYNQAISKDYDLILLDLKMDEMDGMQLFTSLREKKPDIPVIIMTGYPSKESKEQAMKLGVSNYILKPFNPEEIIDPVNKIFLKKLKGRGKIKGVKEIELPVWKSVEPYYQFYNSAWLQEGLDGTFRIGGVIPGLFDKHIESIELPEVTSDIYRGLPLAKVTLMDDKEIIIPSALSGKIIELNNKLIGNPDLLENIKYGKDLIARIIPNNLEAELKNSEIKRIGVISKKGEIKDTCFKQLSELGYKPEYINSIEAFSKVKTKVVVIDAEIFGFMGTKLIETLNQKFPNVKIVVINKPESGNLEYAYRKNKIFYYGVKPVNNKEFSDIMYSAYCLEKQTVAQESTVSSFLPKNVKRIKVTNRFGKKVTLLSFDNLLYHNKGIGFLLIKDLLDKSYPVELNYTRSLISTSDRKAVQKINNEKEKSDKIVILHSNDMNKLPGSIIKEVKSFSNSTNANNSQTTITVQPAKPDDNTTNFDLTTNMALAEIIEKEIISK